MKKLVFMACLLFASTIARAQYRNIGSNNGSWFILSTDTKITPKWGIHLETQVRRSDFAASWQQLFLRPGINYYVNKNLFFNASYLFLETYPYGKFPAKSAFPEHAIWESLNLKNSYNKLEWVYRLQLEQRFINIPTLQNNVYLPGNSVYSNRARVLNRLSVPFKGNSITPNSFYVTAFDEVFINFGKNVNANIFDQNRIYTAVGYKLAKNNKIEMGYMLQSVMKSDGIKLENNHLLQVSLLSNFDISTLKAK